MLNTQKFAIPNIAGTLDFTRRLAQRELIHPNEFDLALETPARMHKAGAPYRPFLILCFDGYRRKVASYLCPQKCRN